MNKLKILIVEDHYIFRLGLVHLLSRNKSFRVVGEATDGLEAATIAEEKQPDVVLLDVHLPELEGPEACRKILSNAPHVKILVLSAETNENCINDMIQAGAVGYILKNASDTELANAIEVVAQGNSYFSKEVSTTILSRLRKPREGKAAINYQRFKKVKLSKRESEILKLIAEEFTNKEIASELFISQRTVDTHRRNLLQKLEVRNTAGLVKFYLRWVENRMAG